MSGGAASGAAPAPASAPDPLALVPDVVLFAGTAKYVLLTVRDPASGSEKRVVRSADREFHKGVKQETERELRRDARTASLVVSCPGGGRIRHDPDAGVVFVYGYSNAYGVGDHKLACELIRRAFPSDDSANVSWSNDGY